MGSGAERRLALREKECAEVFGACAAHATGRFSATFVDEHSQAESQIILGECERERGSFCRCSCSHSFVNLNNNDNNHKKKKVKRYYHSPTVFLFLAAATPSAQQCLKSSKRSDI